MAENIQLKIGENGEVVELPLKRYEELLGYEELVNTSICVPTQEFERLLEVEAMYLDLCR